MVKAVLVESYEFRRKLHRLTRTARCDLRPVQVGDHLVLRGTCPCTDFLVDVLLDVAAYLDGQPWLDEPAAAARVHLKIRASGEWIRRGRIARGAQARTDRIRQGEYGRRLPDELHRAVLEYLVDEAGLPTGLDDDDALVRRLAERAWDEFGGCLDDHRVAVLAALPVIEGVCSSGRRTRVDGVLISWWERYVVRPLGRRPHGVHQPLPADGAAAVEVEGATAVPSVDDLLDGAVGVLDHLDTTAGLDGLGGVAWAEAVLDAAVLRAVTDLPAGADPRDWLVTAVTRLAEEGILPEQVACAFVADPSRVLAAARALDQLLPKPGRQPLGRAGGALTGRLTWSDKSFLGPPGTRRAGCRPRDAACPSAARRADHVSP
ncbi:hypothetical protein FraQA3DRAFT_3318 [Frankia sp. QA3]|nr:hypothetical protein FraQA3DRAFT_3318 [Frankia sp. QA3]